MTMKVEVKVAGELYVFNVPVGAGVTIADASVSLSFVKEDVSPMMQEADLLEIDAPRGLTSLFNNSPYLAPSFTPYSADNSSDSSSTSSDDEDNYLSAAYTPFRNSAPIASELLFTSAASDTTCGCGREESEHGRPAQTYGYEDDFEPEDEEEEGFRELMKKEMEELLLGEEVAPTAVAAETSDFEITVQRAFSESAIINHSDAFSSAAFSAPPRPVSFYGFDSQVAKHTAKWVDDVNKEALASQFDAIFNRRKTVALQAGSGIISATTAIQTESEAPKKTESTQTSTTTTTNPLRRAMSLPALQNPPKPPTTPIRQTITTSTQTTSSSLHPTINRGTHPTTTQTTTQSTQATPPRKIIIESATSTSDDIEKDILWHTSSRRFAYLPHASDVTLKPIPEVQGCEEAGADSEGEGKIAGEEGEEFVLVD
ncbi:hypothetical protein HDV00_010438 [Rhizophlyctis rosea]|nr:hypothetical protein HDV00_010438 [Rhizophlyctis rosea]